MSLGTVGRSPVGKHQTWASPAVGNPTSLGRLPLMSWHPCGQTPPVGTFPLSSPRPPLWVSKPCGQPPHPVGITLLCEADQ